MKRLDFLQCFLYVVAVQLSTLMRPAEAQEKVLTVSTEFFALPNVMTTTMTMTTNKAQNAKSLKSKDEEMGVNELVNDYEDLEDTVTESLVSTSNSLLRSRNRRQHRPAVLPVMTLVGEEDRDTPEKLVGIRIQEQQPEQSQPQQQQPQQQQLRRGSEKSTHPHEALHNDLAVWKALERDDVERWLAEEYESATVFRWLEQEGGVGMGSMSLSFSFSMSTKVNV